MSELDQYDYDLPQHLIAQQPLAQRTDARLLVVDRSAGEISHKHVRDLPELLRPGDCLVTNESRVIPARLVGYKTLTKGRWEGLFLSASEGTFRLLCKVRGKLSPGDSITLVDRQGQDGGELQLLARLPNGVWGARIASREDPFELLDRVGRVPLPRYVRGGQMLDSDVDHYQTVFARKPGAVAAPTAGLHFTRELVDCLKARGVHVCAVTLHVGLDTFRPITAMSLAEHPMHTEWGSIEPAAVDGIRLARERGGRVIAVGTTSVRVLETAASDGELKAWSGDTHLFIRPPYRFRAVDVLMTNFHLPRTTLLVLVRTFGGDDLIRRAYHEAVAEQYRFYSYGDAMLIL